MHLAYFIRYSLSHLLLVYLHYFRAAIGFWHSFHDARIKRESGAKPEQTRYCKFCNNTLTIYTPLFLVNKNGKAAQSGNKPGDLPLQIDFKLSRMRLETTSTIYPVYVFSYFIL